MMILNAVSVTGLLLSLTGLAAYNLSQEKTKSVKLGDKVSILCTAEDDENYISWYQQKADAAPQFLLRNDIRASDLPDRFTYTDSGNQDYLTIDGVRAEDEAVYYCACVNCAGEPQCSSPTEPSYRNLLHHLL
uniref:Ig-like domain-containing protein n=1 Tax=Cyprinus carpio TaxID=7962 RepID=A0A8C1NHX9_CYPCA